jgi:oligopeptide/dipeptide ABC transporter ATP-binding protein
MPEHLLEVRGLKTQFPMKDGLVKAVDGVDFHVDPGETLGIVGESGSGKSMTVLSLMRLLPRPGRIVEGEVLYKGRDLTVASEAEMQEVRGAEIAMIFQDPMTSLNPVYRTGWQVGEPLRLHKAMDLGRSLREAIAMFTKVGIPEPQNRINSYPHEFSGGMRQRAMIAMGLTTAPSVLIADEPTTALDVTIQAQILERIKVLRDATDTAVILVTHDLGVVADVADRIVVMYAGRIVEQGTVDEIFYDPQHPYTWGLLGSITRLDRERPKRLPSIPGSPPSLLNPPVGCHFRPRCPHEFDRCAEVPPLAAHVAQASGHLDRCWLSVEEKRKRREVSGGQIGLAQPQEAPA